MANFFHVNTISCIDSPLASCGHHTFRVFYLNRTHNINLFVRVCVCNVYIIFALVSHLWNKRNDGNTFSLRQFVQMYRISSKTTEKTCSQVTKCVLWFSLVFERRTRTFMRPHHRELITMIKILLHACAIMQYYMITLLWRMEAIRVVI